MVNDWLGNTLDVGDAVLYSSTSSLSGMNLGEITSLNESRIQIKLWMLTQRSSGATYMPGRVITLQRGTSAFKSVTRYFGKLPNKEKL